jgi:hypothetical protein
MYNVDFFINCSILNRYLFYNYLIAFGNVQFNLQKKVQVFVNDRGRFEFGAILIYLYVGSSE